MRTECAIQGLINALSIALLVSVSARAADAPLTPAEAKAKMEAGAQEIATVRSNIVLTLEQLDLIRHTNNPQAQFQQFSSQLTNMEAQVNIVGARARAMKERGDAYFATGEVRIADIQDPQMRQWAQTRYTARKQSYDHLVQYLQQARGEFNPLLAELKQIKTLLEGSRDPVSIAGAKDLFTRANWHCVNVQRALMQAEAEFTFLASDLTLDAKPAS